MATKKTAKKADDILRKIAEEMNEVMAYGKDPDTGDIDESELIDVELSPKALEAEIKKRAEEDLREDDEDSFSPDVWAWFAENGLTPSESEPEEDEDEDEEPAPKKKAAAKKPAPKKASKKVEPEEDDEDDEDEEPAPKSKKKPVKKAKEEPEDDEDEDDKPAPKKKATPKKNSKKEGKRISFEQIAIDIVANGGDYDAVLNKFTELYNERGENDEEFIAKRAKIYYNIACKAAGIDPKQTSEKSKKKPAKKAPKKVEPEEDEDEEPEEDEDEEPAPKSKKKPAAKKPVAKKAEPDEDEDDEDDEPTPPKKKVSGKSKK